VTNTSSEPPDVEQPIWKVVMPSLTFSASQPERPPNPGPQYALVIPDYHVERGWVFTGHVEDTSGQGNKSAGDSTNASTTPPQKKKGFWGKLKRFFAGSQPPVSAVTSDTEN
jgi:hypothetical protein